MKRLPRHLEVALSALGRRVAAVQRNLPRPSQRRIANFRAIRSAASGPLLVVLCEPRTRWDALWSLWSGLRFFSPSLAAAIFVDGEIDPSWAAQARRLFPDVRIESAPQWLKTQNSPLARYPAFQAGHPFTRKFALLAALQAQFDVVYCDADVLFFSEPADLRSAIAARQPCYLLDCETEAFDPWLRSRAELSGLRCEPKLNSGLMVLPRGMIDDAKLALLLDGWTLRERHRFAEQTLFGILLPTAGGTPLPSANYVVSSFGMYFWHDDIDYQGVIARHFVGTVRHLMYSTGYRRLIASAQCTDSVR